MYFATARPAENWRGKQAGQTTEEATGARFRVAKVQVHAIRKRKAASCRYIHIIVSVPVVLAQQPQP